MMDVSTDPMLQRDFYLAEDVEKALKIYHQMMIELKSEICTMIDNNKLNGP